MNRKVASRPLYQQLRNRIALEIVQGKYPPGSTLPGLHDLARDYQVSFSTAATALRLLAEEGLIRCSKGRAARVLVPKPEQKHWRIAVSIGDLDEAYSEFPYQGGSSIWTLHQLVLRKLLSGHHSALNVSGPEWERHLSEIDGILLLRPDNTEKSLEQLAPLGIPHVVITTYHIPGALTNCVDTDFAPGVSQAAIRLLCHGVKTIFTALHPAPHTALYTERFASFFSTLRDQKFPAESLHEWPQICEIGGRTIPDKIRETVIPALATAPRPIGVLSCSDIQSYGILEAAKAAGLTPKKDFFIIGASGLPESALRTPALTVVGPAFEKLAITGIEMLYRMLNNHIAALPGVTCPVKFVTRDT